MAALKVPLFWSWSLLLIAELCGQTSESQKLCEWGSWSAWGSCDQQYKFRERSCPDNCNCEGKKFKFEVCDFDDLYANSLTTSTSTSTNLSTIPTTTTTITTTKTGESTSTSITPLAATITSTSPTDSTSVTTATATTTTNDKISETTSTPSTSTSTPQSSTTSRTSKLPKPIGSEDNLAVVLKLYQEEIERLKSSQTALELPVSSEYQYETRPTRIRSTLARRRDSEATASLSATTATSTSSTASTTTTTQTRVTIPWYTFAPTSTTVGQPAAVQLNQLESTVVFPISSITRKSGGYGPTAIPSSYGGGSSWSECLPSCGPGMKFKENPCGAQGQTCKEWAACSNPPCPISSNGYGPSAPVEPAISGTNPTWSPWTDWSSCTCRRYRSRVCQDPSGKNCEGANSDYDSCGNNYVSPPPGVPKSIGPPAFTPPSIQHVPLRPGDYVIGPGSLPNVGCGSSLGCDGATEGPNGYGSQPAQLPVAPAPNGPVFAQNIVSRRFGRPLASPSIGRINLKKI